LTLVPSEVKNQYGFPRDEGWTWEITVDRPKVYVHSRHKLYKSQDGAYGAALRAAMAMGIELTNCQYAIEQKHS